MASAITMCRWGCSVVSRVVPSRFFQSKRSLHTTSNLSLLLKNYMIPTVRVEQDIQAVTKSLEKKVALAPLFYQNAPVVLDFEATEGKLESSKVINLFNQIHKLNLIPVGITFTQDPIIQDLAKQYNIPFINSARVPAKPLKTDESSNSHSSPLPSHSQSQSHSQFLQQKPEKMHIRTFSNTIQQQPATQQQQNETISNFHINASSYKPTNKSPDTINLQTKNTIDNPLPTTIPPPNPSTVNSSTSSISQSTLSSSSHLPSAPSTSSESVKKNGDESASLPLIVKASLRSGQQVYARNGADLIIMGSVHSGAEALADGNIHIYGSLKGRALAGVSGNSDAKIFSGRFHAELISIGDTYCSCEEQPPGTDPNKPSVVWLENGNLKFSTMD